MLAAQETPEDPLKPHVSQARRRALKQSGRDRRLKPSSQDPQYERCYQ